jgi:GNAT superfamily N-acetyltransferase
MIRQATAADVADLLRLIRALAEYEREPDAVETTEASLREAMFGAQPFAHALVAETSGRVIGMAIWFFTFSTWTGRPSVYLEDLFVEPAHRGHGAGRALMASLAAIATDRGCPRMEWSVLDWNEPSIAFYKTLGARPMDEWTSWRLSGAPLRDLANLS